MAVRTLPEQCAYAMRRYPTPLHNGQRYAEVMYEGGYYHALVEEYGSQAAQPFAEWLEMHGVEVETIDDEPAPTLAEPEPTLAVTPAAEPKPNNWRQHGLKAARGFFNWLRTVDLNKYDIKKMGLIEVIQEDETVITLGGSPKSATKTGHGANRTSHGANRTSHGANRTSHGANRTSHGANRTSHESMDDSHDDIAHLLRLYRALGDAND